MATNLGELQSKLWEAADQLRANSGLKASEYASPVLGLMFLRYADERFAQTAEATGPGSARRPIGPDDYQAAGALYLPEESRFETLLDLPEDADMASSASVASSRTARCSSSVNSSLMALSRRNSSSRLWVPALYSSIKRRNRPTRLRQAWARIGAPETVSKTQLSSLPIA